MKSCYLSFDLGASSGRAIVTIKDEKNLEFDEIFRFKNQPYEKEGTLYWDFKYLFKNILEGLQLSFHKYPDIKAIGIDTWGVDYGLIDETGNLIRDPVCYRDLRSKKVEKDVQKIIGKTDLYKKTGIQYLHFNTIFQLAYDAKYNSELLKKADKMLLIPDLIAFFLTGHKRIELTNLSTTSFYNPNKKEVIPEIKELGITPSLIPELINPGEEYGLIKKEISEKLGIPQIPVVAVCSHDTASAILSIPYKKPHIYISSGTWSLCGVLLNKPLTNELALKDNYTNEIGFKNSIRFLKNIMGLWIINECKGQWEKEGLVLTFTEMEQKALSSRPFQSFIDPDDPLFEPPGDMPNRIKYYCRKTGQNVPETVGEICRCIYQSLAFKYRYVIEKLEKIVKRHYKRIIIIGGGTKINLLNQMTASAVKKEVLIGLKEATIMGNALVLMLYSKDISTIHEGKELIKKFSGGKSFLPLQTEEYDKYYDQFCKIVER
jgi:sugar (pentulose or hexulose) kinase